MTSKDPLFDSVNMTHDISGKAKLLLAEGISCFVSSGKRCHCVVEILKL